MLIHTNEGRKNKTGEPFPRVLLQFVTILQGLHLLQTDSYLSYCHKEHYLHLIESDFKSKFKMLALLNISLKIPLVSVMNPIDLFSLVCLFLHYRSCDNTLENDFFVFYVNSSRMISLLLE